MQIVDNDLLLQGDHALRVQELRFLKQQLVSIHLVLLQARRQLLVNLDLRVCFFNRSSSSLPACEISDRVQLALTVVTIKRTL